MSKLAAMRSKGSESKVLRDRLGRFAAKNAPDLIGGLATRQVVSVTTSALNAKQKLIAKETYKKAQRLQKLKILGAETRNELKKSTEKLGDDITGYVLGNAIANVTSKTLGKSILFIGGTATYTTYTVVPKLVKLRKQIARKHGNYQ